MTKTTTKKEVPSRCDLRKKTRKFLERQLITLESGDALPPIRVMVDQWQIGRRQLDGFF